MPWSVSPSVAARSISPYCVDWNEPTRWHEKIHLQLGTEMASTSNDFPQQTNNLIHPLNNSCPTGYIVKTRHYRFIFAQACSGTGLKLTKTVVSHLVVACRTGTAVAALCINALVLTDVLAGSTLVQVRTAHSVRVQWVAGLARAAEAALRVLTRVLARRRLLFALVYICNIPVQWALSHNRGVQEKSNYPV